ncbi:unnamed protein product [Caenorhabditis angaria]|uniref:Sulfhydryl oxidase n=1 Tax=Caenorhabditis angaria TaxID=860376 RepID=A0A9P1N3E1_9PELO|nr:unnamed protein product [Caenorhabditis angaria]
MDNSIGPDGKPCKACISVEDMMKKGEEMAEKLKKNQAPSTSSETPTKKHKYPVDKDELGRSTWNLLHTMSVYYPEKPSEEQKNKAKRFMNLLGQLYPCDFCAKDLRKDLIKSPHSVSSRENFVEWMCQLHNKSAVKTWNIHWKLQLHLHKYPIFAQEFLKILESFAKH